MRKSISTWLAVRIFWYHPASKLSNEYVLIQGKGHKTMSRASLRIALVMTSVFLIFTMASAGSADDREKVTRCQSTHNLCYTTCPTFNPQVYQQCVLDCISRYTQCLAGNPLPGSTAPAAAEPKSPTGTTQVAPKGQGLRQPIGVSGDKQVGGVKPPKGKGVLDTVNVGGDKQLGTSKPPKGKIGLDRVNVRRVKPLGTGTSTQPIGKVKVNTEVSRVKRLNQGWNSPSTSGGTTTIQRTRGGKKH